ncbi:MAG: hypothetical protein HY225_00840 [Candidatus Vogelbacteria bacterium]|nr:hypothetical protein [Candidatus Vogelbacteria bacterium]
MISVNLADFRKIARASLDADMKKYAKGKELEINQRLLGKFLVENFDRFRRCVTQSEETLMFMSGMGHYYDIMSEIWCMPDKRLFFEVINENLGAVNFSEEKSGTDTSPPTVTGLDLTNELCHQIVDHLVASEVLRQSNKNRDLVTVPSDFYVFEFMMGGKDTRITVPPFKAKNLNEAMNSYTGWSGLDFCPYPKNFRVCTKDGWQKLKSKLDKYAMSGAGPRDYILSLP